MNTPPIALITHLEHTARYFLPDTPTPEDHATAHRYAALREFFTNFHIADADVTLFERGPKFMRAAFRWGFHYPDRRMQVTCRIGAGPMT